MARMKKFLALASMALAGATSVSAQAADKTSWALSSGASYSKGDYGDISATKVLAVPVSLTYRRGGLKVRVSLPFVRISGPGSLIETPEGRDAGGGFATSGSGDSGSGSNSGPGSSSSGSGSGSSGSGSSGSGTSGSGSLGSGGGGPGPSGGGSSSGDVGSGTAIIGGGTGSTGGTGGTGGVGGGTSSGRRSGIGDLSIAATYSFGLGGNFYLEPGAKLKLPTASRTKRIGTGKVDVTVSADIVKEIEEVTVYLGGRRRFTGKPLNSALRSTWGASVGGSVRANRTVLVGADYDWQQSSIRGRGPSSEVTGWTSFRLSRHARLTLSATKGLSQSSADFATAGILSWRF